MSKNRLEAFSDGVFAIAITLLVLGIKLPDSGLDSNDQLNTFLATLTPSILTFVFTFLVVGVFWVAHHRVFNPARGVDNFLLWANVFYLMTVAIIPFPAAILARHFFFPSAILAYTVTLSIVAAQHFLLIRHIYHSEALRQPFFTAEMLRLARRNTAANATVRRVLVTSVKGSSTPHLLAASSHDPFHDARPTTVTWLSTRLMVLMHRKCVCCHSVLENSTRVSIELALSALSMPMIGETVEEFMKVNPVKSITMLPHFMCSSM